MAKFEVLYESTKDGKFKAYCPDLPNCYTWASTLSEAKKKMAEAIQHHIEEPILDRIICGNNLELIEEIPDEYINLVITSPPYYKQRNYGSGIGNEEKLEEYIENLCELFHECVRVIQDNGNIVFNIGDKYESESLLLAPYRFAIEVLKREPVKLVNNTTWLKLNPTPRQFKRRLVSSTEPFFHFVKSNNYYYNVDAFMGHLKKPNTRNRDSSNMGKSYFKLIEESALSEKEKDMARKELSEVIQEVKIGKIDSFRMKIRGIHSEPFGGQEGGRKIQLEKKGFTIIKIYGNVLKRDVIECPVETIKGCKHPAIYPEYIIQQFIRLLTQKNNIILDPFMGSGTTAVACKKLGRHYIGFEINSQYCEYAEQRLQNIEYLLG